MKKSILDVFFERNGIDREAFLRETAADNGIDLKPDRLTKHHARTPARVLLEATAVLASQRETRALARHTARAYGKATRKNATRTAAAGGVSRGRASGSSALAHSLGYETVQEMAEAFRETAR